MSPSLWTGPPLASSGTPLAVIGGAAYTNRMNNDQEPGPPAEGVSYVVTVFNKAAFLRPALEAIAAEWRITGGEIIVVDDGSTDDSAFILREFASGHPWTRIISQPNRGVAAATNTGIACAACRYLRLVDGDDRIVAGSTARLIRALEETGCGLAFGRMGRVGDGEGHDAAGEMAAGKMAASDMVAVTIAAPLRLMLRHQPFIPAATLALTARMREVIPLPEQYRRAQDFALGLKLAVLTGFARIDSLCCLVPAGHGGLSADMAAMYRDTALIARDLGAGWAVAERRLAISRNAGRARNYLRRHAPDRHARIVWVSLAAIWARVAPPWRFPAVMTYIADSYLPGRPDQI